MKKTAFLISTCFLVFCSVVSAQQNSGAIRGTVTEGKQKAESDASVSLLASDSAIIKTIPTAIDGAFVFRELPAGWYFIKVSAVGRQPWQSARIEVGNQPVDLPEIHLTVASKELNAVTVTAHKPFIEQKIDRTVVNVEAAVTNTGATALEVLEKSPGVMVDKDGNISLKGKQGVMVMLDGRPSYLTGDQLNNLLKSMPASAIDQIEIITNPSARYDAAGNSGIINIKTKKNKQRGFNGSLTANYGQGVYWKTNNSFNLNYRAGKVNIFANGGYSVWNGFQRLAINRRFLSDEMKQVTGVFDQVSMMYSHDQNYSLKLGADYYVTGKTTLGLVVNGNFSPEDQLGKNTSQLMNPSNEIDSLLFASSSSTDRWKNKSLNLNLRHQFDTLGQELTADVDLINYGSRSEQLFNNTIADPDGTEKYTETLRGKLPVNINIYTAKIDYTKPLKNGKLEAGLKGSRVNTGNEANYANLVNQEWENDWRKSNHFQYRENLFAAYLNYNTQWKKWSLQSGLRYEHTQYTGDQNGNPTKADSSFTRNYGSLFPTVFVRYAANDKNQFAIAAGRRIDRPAYQNLNPFLFFIDKFTYGQGNTGLQPQFTNNLELTHTYRNFLTTTVNYSYSKNVFAETFEPNGQAVIVKQGNIGKKQNAGVSVSAQVPVKKWLTSILYANYNYTVFEGMLNGEMLKVSAGNVLFNLNNQFKFNKGWSAELSGWYRTKGVEGQILINDMGAAAAGVAKQVLKGKGTVKLNVRDMFYTQQASGNINFRNTLATFRNSRDSRVVNISLVYRFGKPLKDSRQRRNTGGAGEEQNRVKMGNNN
ncbi:MAG: TonB-dependent receptor [Flavihumibacter sp.]